MKMPGIVFDQLYGNNYTMTNETVSSRLCKLTVWEPVLPDPSL